MHPCINRRVIMDWSMERLRFAEVKALTRQPSVFFKLFFSSNTSFAPRFRSQPSHPPGYVWGGVLLGIQSVSTRQRLPYTWQ
jgi:hypothetical protein